VWLVSAVIGLAAVAVAVKTRGAFLQQSPFRTTLASSASLSTDGPGSAWLERSAQANGGEWLRGETRIAGDASRGAMIVAEEAVVDSAGRLVRAELRMTAAAGSRAVSSDCCSRAGWSMASAGAAAIDQVTIDAKDGSVRWTFGDGRTELRRVPTDLPWIYRVPGARGAPMITPVSAWVARRAADHSGAARLVDPRGGDSAMTADQFSIPGSRERWVVLGNDLATFAQRSGRDELVRLRLTAPDLQLTASHNP
jgi:hypothetical protein